MIVFIEIQAPVYLIYPCTCSAFQKSGYKVQFELALYYMPVTHDYRLPFELCFSQTLISLELRGERKS